ncbi:MAG: phosphotyrosine protein phosphatase [Candidatus Bathyarchaeota archaeon]|nr:MAG: phosphotyrosine protein phosphatase [Candidatus Bathyarchaeota archaeon]
MKQSHHKRVKILFVCTGNRDRSPTAQELVKDAGIEARSAGTSETAPVQLSKSLIDWADKVIVMEPRHQEAVLKIAPKARKKVACLNIPDEFCYNQPELRTLLGKKLHPHLNIFQTEKPA